MDDQHPAWQAGSRGVRGASSGRVARYPFRVNSALSPGLGRLLLWTILESLAPVVQRIEPECRRSSEGTLSPRCAGVSLLL